MNFSKEHLKALKCLLNQNPYVKYRDKPVEFCREVLQIELYDKQIQIFEALLKHRKVLVKSCNGAGKSLTAAAFALWVYLCWNPSETVISGITENQIRDVTFKEIRKLYLKAGGSGMAPKAMRLESHAGHYIKGKVNKTGDASQGLHPETLAIIFEEASGVSEEFFDAARGMLQACGNGFFLCIYNPTDTSAHIYKEEMSGAWETIQISCWDHPNIKSQLKGGPIIIPNGINLQSLKENMTQWGTWIKEEDYTPSDVIFEEFGQPKKWWSPTSPDAESRLQGQYPSRSAYSIFADSDFTLAQSFNFEFEEFFDDIYKQIRLKGCTDHTFLPQMGIDVARFGDDKTCFHMCYGKYSFLHESHSGKDTLWIANRAKELCKEWGAKFGITAQKIPVKIDDTGVGGGVTDNRGDFNFIGINAATQALEDLNYPNKRSELLFNLALLMREGSIRLSSKYIDKRIISEIHREALSQTYKADCRGRRVATGKDKIKELIKKSPDNLDAICLAYAYPHGLVEHHTLDLGTNPLIRRDSPREMFGVSQNRRKKSVNQNQKRPWER